MKGRLLKILTLAAVIGLAAGPGLAQQVDPVAQRAIDGAKAYVKKRNLQNPQLTILLSSLYNQVFPVFTKKWEELTGVKMNIVPLGYTDIPAKIMAEAVAKTGQFDIFNDTPSIVPDAAGAKVLLPLDEFAKMSKLDFSGIVPGLRFQQYYQGKLFIVVLDGDHLILVLRKDILEIPEARTEYKAKFGKEPGCPDTLDEWEQMAAFFHTKKGQTRWGRTFDKDLYGALAYRSINFSFRHFPAYMAGTLYFDKDMKPLINTPRGIQAIKDFASIVKYMPPDVQGWGTPQIYPFWASGQAFSVMSFPSIVGFGKTNPQSVVNDKQLSCLIPGVTVDGKLVRRDPQAYGTGFMVSAYSKHPELAWWFIQWFTSPSIGDDAIAHPLGFFDPFRDSNWKHPGIIKKFGEDFLKVQFENTKNVVSLLMLEGNVEYFNILDKNLAEVMNANITAEEAAKRIEASWNKVTNDIGRSYQIRAWRQSVESGIYIDKFK